MIKQILAKL